MTPPHLLRPIARRALAAQSDERLVKLTREGHEPAFEEIVRRYRSPLLAFATAIVPHHRAEDVVQMSLQKALGALGSDDREIVLRPWLFTIVRNTALNAIRDEPEVVELDPSYDGVPQPPEVAERHEELERLVLAICALPDGQRQALVKRELEGVGHGEIAAQLGTSATAVRGLIFRARTALRDSLGALVPMPLIRALVAEGSTAGAAAGAGAGMSAGSMVIGGAAGKVGIALTASVLVLGTGIAIENGGKGGDGGSDGISRVQQAGSDGGAGGYRVATAAHPQAGASQSASRGVSGSGHEDSSGHGSGSSGPDSGGGDSSGSGSGGDDSSGPGSGDDDSSGSGSGGDDDSSGSGSGDDDDHSSSGDGSDDSGDDSGDDSSGSGSGDSGSDDEPDEPDEPDAPDEPDHSGSGSDEPDHSSGDDLEDLLPDPDESD